MPRFVGRAVEIAGLVALSVVLIAGSQPSYSQGPGGFLPSGDGTGSPDTTETDSISRDHFQHQLDGPSGIQPVDAAAAEARRQGLIGDQNSDLEEAVNRPIDLFLGGILRSPNDNNIGGTNNP